MQRRAQGGVNAEQGTGRRECRAGHGEAMQRRARGDVDALPADRYGSLPVATVYCVIFATHYLPAATASASKYSFLIDLSDGQRARIFSDCD